MFDPELPRYRMAGAAAFGGHSSRASCKLPRQLMTRRGHLRIGIAAKQNGRQTPFRRLRFPAVIEAIISQSVAPKPLGWPCDDAISSPL